MRGATRHYATQLTVRTCYAFVQYILITHSLQDLANNGYIFNSAKVKIAEYCFSFRNDICRTANAGSICLVIDDQNRGEVMREEKDEKKDLAVRKKEKEESRAIAPGEWFRDPFSEMRDLLNSFRFDMEDVFGPCIPFECGAATRSGNVVSAPTAKLRRARCRD